MDDNSILSGDPRRMPKAKVKPITRDKPLKSKYLTQDQLDQVERMAGYGTPIKEIGVILGYNGNTFYEWYTRCTTVRHVYDLGRAVAKDMIRGKAFRKCVEGDAAMIRWWLMCQDGWVPKADINVTAQVDTTITVVAREITRLSPQERIAQSEELREKVNLLDVSEISDFSDFDKPIDGV